MSDASLVTNKILITAKFTSKMLKYSIIQVSNLSAVPEVCKDLVRSLGRDYRVYSITSKDSNRTAREIVLSTLFDGAA